MKTMPHSPVELANLRLASARAENDARNEVPTKRQPAIVIDETPATEFEEPTSAGHYSMVFPSTRRRARAR